MNSRAKGKRGELEACRALAAALRCGVERTAQYCGKNGTADLKIEALPLLHVEVKTRGEPITPSQGIQFLEQATEDSSLVVGTVPITVFRWNNMTRYAYSGWLDELEKFHRMLAEHEAWKR
jgi:hypothetical protein